jgi:hypothetical protein
MLLLYSRQLISQTIIFKMSQAELLQLNFNIKGLPTNTTRLHALNISDNQPIEIVYTGFPDSISSTILLLPVHGLGIQLNHKGISPWKLPLFNTLPKKDKVIKLIMTIHQRKKVIGTAYLDVCEDCKEK